MAREKDVMRLLSQNFVKEVENRVTRKMLAFLCWLKGLRGARTIQCSKNSESETQSAHDDIFEALSLAVKLTPVLFVIAEGFRYHPKLFSELNSPFSHVFGKMMYLLYIATNERNLTNLFFADEKTAHALPNSNLIFFHSFCGFCE